VGGGGVGVVVNMLAENMVGVRVIVRVRVPVVVTRWSRRVQNLI